MVTGLLDRPLAGPGTADGTAPATGLRARIRALLARPAPAPADPADAERERVLRIEQTRALLEAARTTVETGWVQDAWYAIRDRSGRLRPVGPFTLALLRPTDVAGACLVGAVVHAAAGASRRPDPAATGPALDLLWETLQEVRGAPAEPVAQSASPAARVARVRELTTWNDEPGRTRSQVLDLVDRTVTRSILDAVRAPAPAAAP